MPANNPETSVISKRLTFSDLPNGTGRVELWRIVGGKHPFAVLHIEGEVTLSDTPYNTAATARDEFEDKVELLYNRHEEQQV